MSDRRIEPASIIGDAVIQKQSARLQHPFDSLKIDWKIRHTDVFEHANTNNTIIMCIIGQGAIVTQLYRYLSLQPLATYPFDSIAILFFTERNAMGVNTIMACRPTDQRTPATTDIEQALTRRQTQLTADIVQLVFLRTGERLAGVMEIGAGIDHLRIQPQAIKIVAEIVMMSDAGARIAPLAGPSMQRARFSAIAIARWQLQGVAQDSPLGRPRQDPFLHVRYQVEQAFGIAFHFDFSSEIEFSQTHQVPV